MRCVRLALVSFSAAMLIQAQQPPQPQPEPRVLSITPQITLRYAAPWKPSGAVFRNAQELVLTRIAAVRPEGATETQNVEYPQARVLITTEQRSSHDDAVKRLQDIAKSRSGTVRFLQIGGWPAVELEFVEALPRRGAPQRGAEPEAAMNADSPQVQRAIVAIAADATVLHFDISLSPDAPASMLQQAEQLATSSAFATQGNPEDVQKSIKSLQESLPAKPVPEGTLLGPPNVPLRAAISAPPRSTVGTVALETGVGELEITTSTDAKNIIVASNSALRYSTNLGGNFTAGSTGVFGLNDPSLARGASGNFYLGVIAFPSGTSAQLGVSGCTNAESRSTNGGSSFALQGYSAECPTSGTGICFPDQEHIAADSVNSSSGNDQVYAVWRRFTPSGTATSCGNLGSGFVAASIVCSKDNAANWTATAAIPGAGDFPRVAVGRDGNVYVVTISGNNVLLNRFSSCASGLTAAAGFPVTVATLSGTVACPVSGLDRCNDGNTLSSPTVAPDPGDAAHVLVTFAESDGAGGERIVTAESNNSGASFPNRRTITSSTGVRRFMPWSCSTLGRAWMGWYDRSAAKASGATNDRTEYFVSSGTGGGVGSTYDLSGNPDPECASGWPCAPRSTKDSESCTVQPQLAGVCHNSTGGGSGTRCDFSSTTCPSGETCQTGGGCPKYGDYNGIACVGDWIIAAWTSATAPAGLPAVTGLSVFSASLFVGGQGATIWSYTGTPCSGNSCPGWLQLDNNPATVAIAGGGSQLYQLHNTGKIWVSTGAGCVLDSCPGWQMLDDNTAAVQIATDSSDLYEFHNTGKIWRYTGTACSGTSCPGWQMLDDNTAAVQIAADSGVLYEFHNTGKIWRYTGTPCSGTSCPGWQMLDDNTAAVAIAAGGGQLYQLHNDGSIWRYTGTPCSGTSCPGWQELDDNTAAVAIAAGNELYQLHVDGSIWRYTGTPCSGTSCPGWQMLDDNIKAVAIAAAGDQLYELHNDGMIWRYTGTPCSSSTSCPGWQMLDDNALTGMIAAADNLYQLHTDPLYQLHTDGSLWRYTGTECDGDFCPGWAQLDDNSATVAMAAAEGQFYQLHNDGSIWRHNGTTCSGASCPGWIKLDDNPAAAAIAAGGSQLYQLHNDGSIWRHNGTPCSGTSCPGWIELDNNPAATAIAAGGNQLFQLHNDGSIWRHNGTPCSGTSCPGWQELDRNPAARAIAAGSKDLFQLHSDGSIWRYTGTPCSGTSCPGWQELDNNAAATAIAAGGKELLELHSDGSIWLYTGTPCSGTSCPGWQKLDDNPAAIAIASSGTHIYQRHNDGSIWHYTGPPCSGTSCPGWARLDDNPAAKGIAAGGFN
ncbi:MAG: hypothetical protein ACLP6W_23320 [Bryobacteraceae bacterium]